MCWRMPLILMIALFAAVAAGAEPTSLDSAAAMLMPCADVPAVQRDEVVGVGRMGGLSLRGLAATVGIGLLSLLFLVPMALLAEWLMGRQKNGEDLPGAWG